MVKYIEKYPIETWNGGKVRKILDNIVLLEREQVFTIEGKTFFTFGGASSHDVEGGIFDRDDIDYYYQKISCKIHLLTDRKIL